ncbi:fimbrial protein [Aeromonas sp. Y318-1]|uniref:F4 family fimbrial subunit n=1 Tax=Aeromonas TaxID=642 RepID=UPI0022E24AD5|nr:fimbrial protein [Aeromonas sp. Y318-1]
MTRTACLYALLPLLALAATSDAARAVVLDQGEIAFAGYIVDEGPRWVWQMASSDQVWDVDTDDAHVDVRGWQIFSLSGRGSLPFLEGHLRKVAERGGVGMTPSVTFSANGVVLSTGTGPLVTRTAIPVKDVQTGEAVGQLAFTLEQALVVAQGRGAPDEASADRDLGLAGMALVTEAVSGAPGPTLAARLSTLMGMNEGSAQVSMPLTLQGERVSRQVLADNRVPMLGGAYASQLSDFELSWPQESVPAQWRATLNVAVTIQ